MPLRPKAGRVHGVKLELRFERELTSGELELLVAEHPSQVHRVPGCERAKAFWFEVDAAARGGRSRGVRAFCICARTVEDALEHATSVADGLSREIGKELA